MEEEICMYDIGIICIAIVVLDCLIGIICVSIAIRNVLKELCIIVIVVKTYPNDGIPNLSLLLCTLDR